VLTIRGSSGSALADVYTDAQGQVLEVVAQSDTQDTQAYANIETWLAATSSTSAYVRTWWDQSGNGKHAEQIEESHQPLLEPVLSSIVAHSARPRWVVSFSVSDRWLDLSLGTSNDGDDHTFVGKSRGSAWCCQPVTLP